MALSFPFFNGWNNWTESEVETAVATSGRVLQSLWQEWPAAGSPDYVEVYNVNVRSLGCQRLPVAGWCVWCGEAKWKHLCSWCLQVTDLDWRRCRWVEGKHRTAGSRKQNKRQSVVPANTLPCTVSFHS